jgi:hypothetical protein
MTARELIFLLGFSCISLQAGVIDDQYLLNCNNTSDIHEHLPRICELAKQCYSITEIGTGSMNATWSLLKGLSMSTGKKTFLGIDARQIIPLRIEVLKQAALESNIQFKYWPVNDLYIQLEPVDMLYIDYLHTYKHLACELEGFSKSVRKYICLHNTHLPWGFRDDPNLLDDYSESHVFHTQKGLWPAVQDFLKRHPEWTILEHRQNNYGFTVLARSNPEVVKEPVYHPNLEQTLKNKMILCTGPSLNRYDLLKKNTEQDLSLIPFKKIFLATNDPNIMKIAFNGKSPSAELIPQLGHQLDCLNCIISCLQRVANDSSLHDDDIILFKHESVYVNDMTLIKKSVSKILEGSEVVTRAMAHLGNANATDAFFIKVSAARKIMKNAYLVGSFTADSTYCEEYLTNRYLKNISQVYQVPCSHLCSGWNELGFYHIISKDFRGWPSWDRSNYYEILK